MRRPAEQSGPSDDASLRRAYEINEMAAAFEPNAMEIMVAARQYQLSLVGEPKALVEKPLPAGMKNTHVLTLNVKTDHSDAVKAAFDTDGPVQVVKSYEANTLEARQDKARALCAVRGVLWFLLSHEITITAQEQPVPAKTEHVV